MGEVQQLVFLGLSLIIVTTLHEFGHAVVAYKLGDDTPKKMGRVSLNPIKHIDWFGFLMVFFIRFGWGKPVQIDVRNFKNPRLYEALTAFAGPLMNLVLSLFVRLILEYAGMLLPVGVEDFLRFLYFFSLVLMVFNLLPLPALDGSRFLKLLIPKRFAHRYEVIIENAMSYTIVFLLFDGFILANYLGFSIVNYFVGNLTFGLHILIGYLT